MQARLRLPEPLKIKSIMGVAAQALGGIARPATT